MRNFVQDGRCLDLTAPRDVASGEGMLIGAIFAIAGTDAVTGAVVTGCTEGVFDLSKKTTATFAVGDRVSWDNTNHYADAPGSGLHPIGYATAAAGNGAATVRVKLAEGPTAAAS